MSTTLIDVSKYQGDEKPKPIIIENNSSLSFSIVSCAINDRAVYKAVFDFSDGEEQEISQPIQTRTNTIEGLEPPDWRIIEHEFNFKQRYEYSEDILDENLPFIKITLYTFVGDIQEVKIPFKVFYKTLYDLGRVFNVESANLTNQCTVSYVLSSGDSEMVIVQSNDWRRMYGETDFTLISNPIESVEAPVNYYTDDDSSVWHWKTKPEMKWIEEPSKIDDSHVVFSWTEGDVPLDRIVLKYKLIDEDEWIEEDITDTEIIDGYKTYTINKNFSNDVLEVSFVIDGGNGIVNVTESLYFRGTDFTKGQMTFDGGLQELDTEFLIKVKPLDDLRYLNLDSPVTILDEYVDDQGDQRTSEYFIEINKDDGTGELHLRKVFISNGNHTFTLIFKQLGNDERIKGETLSLTGFSYTCNIDFSEGYQPTIQDNKIVCKFKILPEPAYLINLKYVINEENATTYNATLELKNEDNQYFYYGTIDGTLIPSESGESHQINIWMEGAMGDPLTCPHDGRRFRFPAQEDEHYYVDFLYPSIGSDLKIQRFCDFEQSGVNQYVFETMTSMFVDPRDDNSKDLKISYVDGTVTRTQSMEKLNRFDLYNDGVEEVILLGYDRRDTLYKRETIKTYDLSSIKFPNIEAFSSLNYLNDPLKYTIGVGYTFIDKEGETKVCKYNDIKNYSLFKVPSTHKFVVDEQTFYCNYDSSHTATVFETITYTEDKSTDPRSYVRYKLNQDYQNVKVETLQQLPESEATFDFETLYNDDDYSYQINVSSTHDVGVIVSENSASLYNGNEQVGIIDFERDELKSFRNLTSGDYKLWFCFNALDTYGETSQKVFVSLFEGSSINFSINEGVLRVVSKFEISSGSNYKHSLTLDRPDGSIEKKNFSAEGEVSFENVVPGDYKMTFSYEREFLNVTRRVSRIINFTV